MSSWSGTRIAAAIATLKDAGMGEQQIARLAGAGRSTVNRWAHGLNRPDHDAVQRLAAGIWRKHPDAARELVEASGYPWAEPSEADLPPPPGLSEATRAAMRRDIIDAYGDPILAEQVIAFAEGVASGRIQPGPEEPADDPRESGSSRRRGTG